VSAASTVTTTNKERKEQVELLLHLQKKQIKIMYRWSDTPDADDFCKEFYRDVIITMLRRYAGRSIERTMYRMVRPEEEEEGNERVDQEMERENKEIMREHGILLEDGRIAIVVKIEIERMIEKEEKNVYKWKQNTGKVSQDQLLPQQHHKKSKIKV